MSSDHILYEICAPHIARITLNRPEARNAQDTSFLYDLNDAFDRAAHDDDVKVIILAANGPHFSSGHDLTEAGTDFIQMVAATSRFDTVGTWSSFGAEGAEGQYARELEIYVGFCERWRNLPKPTIAQVHGKVIAGGLMLIWPCDLIIASDDASFQDNTLLMGLCGVEYFAHPWELGTRKAKELLFTGGVLSATEACALGMVNRVVAREVLESHVLELAQNISRVSGFTLKVTKEAVNAMEDVQGRRSVQQTAFSLHQLLHSHWFRVGGLPADPKFLENSRFSRRTARPD